MKTTIKTIDGVRLIVPDADWFFFPFNHLSDYNETCGPGDSNSLLQRLIPDYIGNMNVSIVCWIHDLWQGNCPPTFSEWIESNIAFAWNLLELNEQFGGTDAEQTKRAKEIVLYLVGVCTPFGWKNFIKNR